MAVEPFNNSIKEVKFNVTVVLNSTLAMPQEGYDAKGAMLFTVATVLLYGMSIVAFIAGHLRRRHNSKEEESQISKYLKRADDIRRQAVRDDVLRLRSQLLAGSVIENRTEQNTERRKSRVERAKMYILNDMNCTLKEAPSAESVILPACTVQMPYSDTSSSKSEGSVFIFPPEDKECNSDEDAVGRSNTNVSKLYIQRHGGVNTRPSLHASLEQSLLNGTPPHPLDDNKSPEPEGSPEFNRSRNYRSRRRGVVHNMPLIMSLEINN